MYRYCLICFKFCLKVLNNLYNNGGLDESCISNFEIVLMFSVFIVLRKQIGKNVAFSLILFP